MKQIATQPCYLSDDKAALAKNVTENFKVIVDYYKSKDTPFLLGNYLTYVDFMLFELCHYISFLTDDSLYEDYPAIERFYLTMSMLQSLQRFDSPWCSLAKMPFNNKIAKINNVPVLTIEYFGEWAKVEWGTADVLIQLLKYKSIPFE